MTRILGAVLAGGASSRFGSDKALATVGGKTLLELAAEALAPFVASVVVVGRDGGVPDMPRSALGPLGGIAGALTYGQAHGFTGVVTIACDMPAVPGELIERLLADAPAYCADAPVLGYWPSSLADGLVRHLASSQPRAAIQGGATPWTAAPSRHGEGKKATLSVRRWADAIGAVPIAATAPLPNVNTLADLPTS